MKHGSLFSGIGGFDLASQWMGWENVFQVEKDEFCRKVLKKNFPKVKRYEDIKDFKGVKGAVDIITGGFPCQPFSQAGKRKGAADDRYLWDEMLRVITEIKPSFVVGENVAGLLSMENGKTLDNILSSLEDEGYITETFIIPACSVGAWHRRDRIWIVAYGVNFLHERRLGYRKDKKETSSGKKRDKQAKGWNKNRKRIWIEFGASGKVVTNTKSTGQQSSENRQGEKEFRGRNTSGSKRQSGFWEFEPNVGRVADGVPTRVDRLKGLGNAIVPQVLYEIFKTIHKEFGMFK